MPRHADPRVARLVALFEQLTPADVRGLSAFYAPGARFKDPFNEVVGVAAIEQVFTHMFEALDAPRFVVRDILVDADQCVLTWDFLFRFRREPVQHDTQGASHLRFDEHGLVLLHRDYWDAAEGLYEKLPLLGTLMRWLRRRAAS